MQTLVKKFIRGEDGLETVEYSVMAALIVVAIIATITALGTSIGNEFTKISTELAK